MTPFRLLHPLILGSVRFLLALLGGLHRQGACHVPPIGGVLICPNHICDADPAAIFASMPRPAWYMAKEELFSLRFLGSLIRLCQAFPVRRDSADRSALRRAEELLRGGEAVVIFPEGGGNPSGLLQPLHPGALLVALRTGVPIVPVALKNTPQILPYGATRPRRSPRPIEVIFGPPLDLSDLHGKKGALEQATRRLTETLAKMLDQPVPDGKPLPHEERPTQRQGTGRTQPTLFPGNRTD